MRARQREHHAQHGGPRGTSGRARGPLTPSLLARSALAALSLGLPVVALLASPASAAPGALDPTFDTDGKVTTDIATASADSGQALAVQPDGKIVVAGSSNAGASTDFAVARYNANGGLDTTFDTDGKVTTDVGAASDDAPLGLAVQADGKILVAGYSNAGGSYDVAVVRYNANGSLDTTFDTDGKATTDIGAASLDVASAVALQTDGRIVVAGYSNAAGNNDFAAVRYTAAGALDTTFDTDGKATTGIGAASIDVGTDVAIQPDGKIVVAGYSNAAGNNDFAAVRYSANGSLDTTFDTDGKATTEIGATSFDIANAVGLQTDGKIVVAGYSNAAGNFDFAAVRYTAAGALDTTFDTDGKATTDIGSATADFANAVAIQADGKIVLAGSTSSGTGDFALVRYTTAGALDTGFNANGKLATDIGSATADFANALALQPDGKVVAAGVSGADFAVVRYEGDPAMLISDASVTEVDFGTTTATFTVGLTAAASAPVTVSFATADGTATAGADYIATAGTLTFAAGETTKTVQVPVRGDGLDEPNETFLVNLSAPTNVAVLLRGQGTGTIVDDDEGPGYWLDASDGGIFAFDAPFSGSTGNLRLNQPIVGMAADPDGRGYWLVASDGGIFAFDAPFFGSTGNLRLNQPIVGMAAAPDGKGYYLVASDGGIFAFGSSAVFKGSTGAIRLNRPVVGMAADPDGSGYFLVASDGGIFAFDAVFKGSTGALTLNRPIVGMAADPDGSGYFLVASDGGIFAFDAVFKGSTGALTLNRPIVGMAADPDGSGYWLVASDGGIFAFDAVFKGSTGNLTLNKPIVGMAART